VGDGLVNLFSNLSPTADSSVVVPFSDFSFLSPTSFGSPDHPSSTNFIFNHPPTFSSQLSLDNVLSIYSRYSSQTIQYIPDNLQHPISLALCKILKSIRNNISDKQAYFEFFIFPLLVLSAVPREKKRKSRSKKKRRTSQRDHIYSCLEKWNNDKDSFINSFLDDLPIQRKKYKNKSYNNSANNLKRAEKFVRVDGQYGKAVQALHSNGIAECSEDTLRLLREKHPISNLPPTLKFNLPLI
jgi:hypothetical protein